MRVAIESKLLGQEETFPWFLLLSRCFKLPNLHVQLTLLFWIPDVISNYPQNISIWMFHSYHKSAYSKPKSSTWSFSCIFHFSKRLHIPCSHQSGTTSLELVILFSISPLQSCLVEGGLYFTQIPFIGSSSSHTWTLVVNSLPSTWHLCRPFSWQWFSGILPSRGHLSRNIFVTTGEPTIGIQLVEARHADKQLTMHRTAPPPPPTWNYLVHNINNAIVEKLVAE